MALPLDNSAEGGTNGTQVIPANSGGASGNAFDVATQGANMTLQFSTAQAMHGSLSYAIALSGTVTAATFLDWGTGSFVSTFASIWGRVYVRWSVAVASTVRLIKFLNGTTVLGYLGLTNTNQGPAWRTGADAASGSIAAGTFAINTWYRFEFNANIGAAAVSTVKTYAGDSLTAFGADGVSAAGALGTTNINHIQIGLTTANYASTSGATLYMDDINFNSTGYPGVPSAASFTSRNMHRVGSVAVQRALTRCQRLTKRSSGLFVPAEWSERLVVAS